MTVLAASLSLPTHDFRIIKKENSQDPLPALVTGVCVLLPLQLRLGTRRQRRETDVFLPKVVGVNENVRLQMLKRDPV